MWVRIVVDSVALTREGVTPDELGRDVQLSAELAHFVLEQLAQRLDQSQAVAGHQTLGDAAHVVVGLDCLRRTLERDTLDNI